MKAGLAAASLIALGIGAPASAHRLDEYLQATTISVEKHRVQAQIRLIPGVAVFPLAMAMIDTNGDGVLAPSEQRAYTERVLDDLSLTIDGDRLPLRLTAMRFPQIDAMKEGLGEIQIDFTADVAHEGSERKLVFENRHGRPTSSYLVNCLVPQDDEIRITAQKRNYEQSLYELTYFEGGVRPGLLSHVRPLEGGGWLGAAATLLLARLALLCRKRRAGARCALNP